MLRAAILRSARTVTRSVPRRQFAIASRTPSAISFKRFGPTTCLQSVRHYSAHDGLSKEEIQGRILDLLKDFDKVKDSAQLSDKAHFIKDLGLDSLDTVEVVMAIEEEFSIEIPDKEADKILSVEQAVDYIQAQPDAH